LCLSLSVSFNSSSSLFQESLDRTMSSFHEATYTRAHSDNLGEEEESEEEYELSIAYRIERALYVVAIILGLIASVYTIRKFRNCYKTNLDVAARLL
ncbi:hypothetical protein PENTCL1PPCAC_16076, partial [Pristionchus entomophagus]